jgi:hypothetical protein
MGAAAEPARAVTTPALLLDEMLSGTIGAQLRARGVDAVAVVEDASLVSTPDEELLVFAAQQQRVLITTNIADFAAIATDWRASGRTHQGIVYVAQRSFAQDRSLVGALVGALAARCDANALPLPGTETFLRRVT